MRSAAKGVWAAACLYAVGTLCIANAAERFDLEQLSALLSRDTAATAIFHERWYRKVLKAPVERSGELAFEPPATFEQRALEPIRETYRLEGDTLRVTREGRRTREVSLREQPVLRGLLRGFQAVVSGRLDGLREYSAAVQGTAADWTLVLTPIDAELARHVESIRASGQQGQLRQFELRERSGDYVLTDVTPVP